MLYWVPLQGSQSDFAAFGCVPAGHFVQFVRARFTLELSHVQSKHSLPSGLYFAPSRLAHGTQTDRFRLGSVPAVQVAHPAWGRFATCPAAEQAMQSSGAGDAVVASEYRPGAHAPEH